MQPPQRYGPAPSQPGYGPPQGFGQWPGYPAPKRRVGAGWSTRMTVLLAFGLLFGGCVVMCVATEVFVLKQQEAERKCNADPVCKAQKAEKAEKDELWAKATQAAQDEKSAAEAKAKAERAEQEAKAKAEKAEQDAKANEQKATEEKAAAAKAAALVALPESEKKFCSTVVAFAKDYKDAPSDNELKRSKVRGNRRQALSALPASASDWLGTITELGTTGDGKAVLAVKVSCDGAIDVKVKTSNNALSDMFDHSLIAQSSKTYATLSELGKGSQIRFNGRFITGDHTDGMTESSLSEGGSMTDPEFIFRFSQVGDARTTAVAAVAVGGGADAAVPPAATSDFDALGAEKDWGAIHATLKDVAVKGNLATASILLKNTEAKEELISQYGHFQVTNEEGDTGEEDRRQSSCSGTLPPNGLLKCKLAYKFASPPKELTIAVGNRFAGMGPASIYFKYKIGK